MMTDEGDGQPDDGGTRHADGSRQLEPHDVEPGGHQPGAEYRPLAEGEVDHARRLVDDDEGEGDQGIDGAGQGPVDEQRDEEQHGLPNTPSPGWTQGQGRGTP